MATAHTSPSVAAIPCQFYEAAGCGWRLRPLTPHSSVNVFGDQPPLPVRGAALEYANSGRFPLKDASRTPATHQWWAFLECLEPPMTSIATSPTPELSALAKRWGIYTPDEQRRKCCGAIERSLIADLIPKQTISLVVGDSGIGKSPLLYQAALCVAAGIPFLGHPTSQGRVLYLDFENGFGQVSDLIELLTAYLGLAQTPETLFLWNYNNAPPTWKPDNLAAMVSAVQPAWVIIDSLAAYAPAVEDKPGTVTVVYQLFRRIAHENQTAITSVHHIRKPSTVSKEPPPALEENPHGWLLQARGSRALVNGSDIRIGIDRPRLKGNSEVALVLGGFSRVSGNIPTTFLSRILDEDDEPIGYQKLTGVDMLWNDSQITAYHKLPITFRFKDAKTIYGREDQATSDFLNKCISLGIMRKDEHGYRKVEIAE
jgi:hypothetical protein